jgi:hypothetical protein
MDSENIILHDLLNQRGRLFTDLKPFLYQALREAQLDLDIDECIELLHTILNAILKIAISQEGINVFATLINRENISSIAQAHRPEICLAHMMAMDQRFGEDHSDKLKQSYYILRCEEKESFEVFLNGKSVAAFEEGVAVERNSSFSYGVDHNQRVVFLPPDQEYEIRGFTAKGKMDVYRQSVNSVSEVLVHRFSASDFTDGRIQFSTPDTLNPKQ